MGYISYKLSRDSCPIPRNFNFLDYLAYDTVLRNDVINKLNLAINEDVI